MNKVFASLVGLLALGALVLGVAAFQEATKPLDLSGVVGQKGEKGDRGERGPQGERGPAGKDAPIKVGALSSPDIMSPYFSFGGVRHWAAQTSSLATATTTVCALRGPVTATSTLDIGTIRLTTSTTTASTVTIAKSATAYATTTSLSRLAVAANAQAFHFASTTAGNTSMVFAPGDWMVVSMEGGTGTFSPTGVCTAVWVEN